MSDTLKRMTQKLVERSRGGIEPVTETDLYQDGFLPAEITKYGPEAIRRAQAQSLARGV